MTAALTAPAKVNLFLHVGAPFADGFHPLASLMVFADVGDRLSVEPAGGQSLTVRGPFAKGLGEAEDNLVMRAARALLAEAGRPQAGFRLILDKQLPLAAGLGGGSSDAGAALRLLDGMLGLGMGEAALMAMAASLGADGAACFTARPVIAEGRGEHLSAAPSWPDLPCVLVNPGVASPTGAVYRAFDAQGRFESVAAPVLPKADSVAEAAALLAPLRNDLEGPALALEPRIGGALAVLAAAPGVRLTRMSGSGATCFGLFDDEAAAAGAGRRIAAAHPRWWVRSCRLLGG